jgi:glycosyltransferase involved in cell wall biosynthesis
MVLRCGGLVVIDEFQRLLDRTTARPPEPLDSVLRKIAQSTDDTGCLWLVLNRELDAGWSEPFFTALLEVPTDPRDLEHIVLQAVAMADAEERFRADRRVEVVNRLGANPRVLRLLGNLLRRYTLEELLGPQGVAPAAPVESRLLEGIERNLLEKAKEALSDAAKTFLRDLTVLRDEASRQLIEAMGVGLGDVRTLSNELRDRYLLENHGSFYQVHPTVREVDGLALRSNDEAWRSAHLRAGRWYVRSLQATAGSLLDAALALDLAGARYHLVEAKSFDELRDAINAIRTYVENSYTWSTRRPTNAGERDARISLLELYLTEYGPPSVEYHLATALRERAAPGDLANALSHAQRATVGMHFSHPWVLWVQLVSVVEGYAPAVAAARTAAAHVAPEQSLYSVYQLLGANLNHLGRTQEAVEALLEGAGRATGNQYRLVAQAQFLAAAEPSDELLERVQTWGKVRGTLEFDPQLALGNAFLLQRHGSWSLAAELVRHERTIQPRYIQLALCEAHSWLGAGDAGRAQEALDRFSLHWRYGARMGSAWLASLVALQRGDVPRASDLLAIYLAANAPSTEAGVRAALLREWDHRVATIGEPNPALMCPILPSTVTGLPANIMRPQYGAPVLPQHQSQSSESRSGTRMRILAIGTEWRSGHGGVSTFNRQLCAAFASAGAEVICLVAQSSASEKLDAQSSRVALIDATSTPGRTNMDALSRKPSLPADFIPDIVIGHGRITGPAAKILAEDHFRDARRLHFIHMAPDEIEWFKVDEDNSAGERAEERTQIELDLGRTAARVVAVGPRLYNRYLTELHPYGVPEPLRLDPAIEEQAGTLGIPIPGEPWKVLLLGRLEDEYLKGLDVAARAVGLVASRRPPGTPALELVVRGARPNTSTEVREKLRAWSGIPTLNVVVRPFTTETAIIDADLRRASLVLMPSRSEGVGLVGLEAIAAGTPLLVSAESGLGAMLREALGADQAGRMIVPMSFDEEDGERWARAVEAVLWDRDAAFRQAAAVRQLLASRNTWPGAVATLIAELA